MVVQSVFPTQKVSKATRIPMRTIRALANQIAKKYNPEEIILFGSHAYGKPHAWSDVDLLVTFEEGKTPGLEIFQLEQALSNIFGGRPVDMVSEKFLNPRMRDGILASAKVLYEK